jgi:hypothetical protein
MKSSRFRYKHLRHRGIAPQANRGARERHSGRGLVSLFLLLPCCVARAQCPVLASRAAAGGERLELQATVGRVSVERVTTDSVQFSLYVSLLSTRDASVQGVTFESLRFNGVPLYAAPITNPVRLKAGQQTNLALVLLTVYYRDLDSVSPLEMLVRDGKVTAEGSLTADLDLTFLEHVALLARRARITTTFHAQLPVNVPGGATGRTAALAVLGAADGTMGAIRSGVAAGIMTIASQWRKQLWRDYAPLLLFVRTSFSVHDRAGQPYAFECTAAGFRISEKEAVLPKEALEPWKFDAEIAAALQSQELRLDNASYDVWVWPAGAPIKDSAGTFEPSQALRQSQQEVRIVHTPRDDNEVRIVVGTGGHLRKVRVHRRVSASNVALVALTPPAVPLPLPAKLDFQADPTKWGRLAAFRFPAVTAVQRSRPELLFIEAARAGLVISLDTPLDASGRGSPLIGPNGIVGIVQSEKGGVSLQAAWQVLGIADSKSADPWR